MILVQVSFHTTLASLFEMELEPNLLDWNVNELERELELEDMKRTNDRIVKKAGNPVWQSVAVKFISLWLKHIKRPNKISRAQLFPPKYCTFLK